jgi:hypothetical protein
MDLSPVYFRRSSKRFPKATQANRIRQLLPHVYTTVKTLPLAVWRFLKSIKGKRNCDIREANYVLPRDGRVGGRVFEGQRLWAIGVMSRSLAAHHAGRGAARRGRVRHEAGLRSTERYLSRVRVQKDTNPRKFLEDQRGIPKHRHAGPSIPIRTGYHPRGSWLPP